MQHSVPLQALAGFFIVMGLVLFALTLRAPKTPPAGVPEKKAEQRARVALEQETTKMRIGGAVLVVFGVILLFIF